MHVKDEDWFSLTEEVTLNSEEVVFNTKLLFEQLRPINEVGEMRLLNFIYQINKQINEVAKLVEAHRNKPQVSGWIPDGVIEIFH
jgi:hypothetical protein